MIFQEKNSILINLKGKSFHSSDAEEEAAEMVKFLNKNIRQSGLQFKVRIALICSSDL